VGESASTRRCQIDHAQLHRHMLQRGPEPVGRSAQHSSNADARGGRERRDQPDRIDHTTE
jgi:hypothetical protein